MRPQLLRRVTVGALILGFGCNRDATAPQLTLSPLLRTESVAAPTLERLYGPERFTRTRGAPEEFTRNVSTLRFEGPFVLHVRSGASDGSHRALAAVVALDGKILLSESDFARQTEWAIPITVGQAAVLGVTLRGAPGSVIEVWMEGVRSDPVFCPDGPPGTYPTLPEAIADARPNGTVLVCDGEHAVDVVQVRKPITLRSQNPGGATLADVDPNPGFQTGRPALLIDSVPTGLVRIVDLNFVVRGRAILVAGLFDQVVIDSVRFSGLNLATSFGVYVASTGGASAKVEITRSRFASLQTGVFPTRAVETNVRHSTFESMGGGSITYSGGTINSVRSSSFGRAEHNTFARCSVAGCVRIVGPPAAREVVIAHNVMTRPNGPRQSAMIVVSRISGLPIVPGAPVIVEHNLASGALIGPGPTWQLEPWSVAIFLTNLGGVAGNPVVLRSNRISTVNTAISASAPITAHDNVLTGGHRAITQADPAVIVDFQRNDVLFETSIFRTGAGGEQGNYRCNWWGSASGPPGANENVTPTSYTPWATAPIAGTSVPCDGTGAPAPPPSVVRVCSVALAGGPPTFPTVSAAYDAVATEGTILICDGTHVVRDVRIAKALTIRGEGPGKPMLDAQGARSNFDIRNVVGGAVVLRGLRLGGTWVSTDESPRPGYGANINIEGSYSAITVESSDFSPSGQLVAYDMPAPGQPRLSHNSGVWVYNAVGHGVLVRNNTFSGGDVGVGGSGTTIIVRSNVFRGQSNAAVAQGSSGGNTVIEDNSISDCGTAWCIAAFSVQHASLTVAGNRITVEAPRRTSRAILADNRDVTIVDNVITGVGGARIDRSSYPIMYAIAAHSSRTNATTNYRIHGNTVTGAYSGIDFASVVQFGTDGPVAAEATNNRISEVATPFSGSGGAGLLTAKLHRNDFSSYVGTDRDGEGTTFKSVELSCNWWGSASGPTGYLPPSWVALVAPVATAPIAGRPDVLCP